MAGTPATGICPHTPRRDRGAINIVSVHLDAVPVEAVVIAGSVGTLRRAEAVINARTPARLDAVLVEAVSNASGAGTLRKAEAASCKKRLHTATNCNLPIHVSHVQDGQVGALPIAMHA